MLFYKLFGSSISFHLNLEEAYFHALLTYREIGQAERRNFSLAEIAVPRVPAPEICSAHSALVQALEEDSIFNRNYTRTALLGAVWTDESSDRLNCGIKRKRARAYGNGAASCKVHRSINEHSNASKSGNTVHASRKAQKYKYEIQSCSQVLAYTNKSICVISIIFLYTIILHPYYSTMVNTL